MLFNSGTNSIVEESRYLAKASSTDLPVADITRSANQALDRMNSLVLGVETALVFDDPNHSDTEAVPLAITSGTATYTLAQDPSTNDILGITQIVLPTSSGSSSNTLVDAAGIHSSELSGYLSGYHGSGSPLYYRRTGKRITFYPTPNYSTTATVYVRRNVKYFTTADTTAAPGFAAPFHRLVPLWVAYWYCVREGKTTTAQQLRTEIDDLESEFIEYYSDSSVPLSLSGSWNDPR